MWSSRFDMTCGRKLQKENRVFLVIKRTEFLVQRKRTFKPVLQVHGPEETLKTKLKTILWVGFEKGGFLTPVAGLIFETKNREIFLERFFWREIPGAALLPVQLCFH